MGSNSLLHWARVALKILAAMRARIATMESTPDRLAFLWRVDSLCSHLGESIDAADRASGVATSRPDPVVTVKLNGDAAPTLDIPPGLNLRVRVIDEQRGYEDNFVRQEEFPQHGKDATADDGMGHA